MILSEQINSIGRIKLEISMIESFFARIPNMNPNEVLDAKNIIKQKYMNIFKLLNTVIIGEGYTAPTAIFSKQERIDMDIV